jgi:hypothetical protein
MSNSARFIATVDRLKDEGRGFTSMRELVAELEAYPAPFAMAVVATLMQTWIDDGDQWRPGLLANYLRDRA